MDADELMAVPVPLDAEPSGHARQQHTEPSAESQPASEHEQPQPQSQPTAEAHADEAQGLASEVAPLQHKAETEVAAVTEPAAHGQQPDGAHAGVAADNTPGRRRGRGGRLLSDKGEPTMMLPSFIWDYFVKDPTGKFVVCTLCPGQSTRFAYSGGTSTMNRHLRKKHHKYAPGKCAADYEFPRRGHRQRISHSQQAQDDATAAHAQQLQALVSPAVVSNASGSSAASGGLLQPDAAAMLGSLSPAESLAAKQQRHQLLELRTARRRAASGGSTASTAAKRRKLLLDTTDPTSATVSGAMGVSSTAEFDPTAFVTLPGSNGSATTSGTGAGASGGLQFPPGFELNDAAMEMTGVGMDQRFFDYSTLTGGTSSAVNAAAAAGLLRGRRHSSSISGPNGGGNLLSATANANNAVSHKVLTHRLLKYLIAQYEPLDVSHMSSELSMLLFGGSTEWPTPGLGFGGSLGYGGFSGSYGGGYSGGLGPKLPSEETIKLALANLYYSQREILKEVVADVEVLSLSLNNWTSAFGQNVLTVSGHWISRGFRRRDCVLEVYVLPLDERVNTIALLRDVMDKWEIPSSKVAALTMRPASFRDDQHGADAGGDGGDNHSRAQTAERERAEAEAETASIHDEYPGLAVVRCFVQELETAVTNGLRECAPLIRRCRNYVSYFIQNPSEYQIFLALQRRMGEEASAASASAAAAAIAATADGVSVSIADGANLGVVDEAEDTKTQQTTTNATEDAAPLSGSTAAAVTPPTPTASGVALPVICDFDDRWNSTSEMICRIVELEAMLLLYKTGLESDTNPSRRPMQLRFVCCELSPEEWATLKQLARLLEPIEGVVHVTPLEYPGLSIVYPLLHSLKKHLEDAAQWMSEPLAATVRHRIASSLNLELCSPGQAPSSAYLPCLLDPRFKTLPFLPPEERERLVALLFQLLGADADGDAQGDGQENDSGADDTGEHHTKHDTQHNHEPTSEDDVEGDERLKKEQGELKAAVTANVNASVSSTASNKKAATLLHEFFPLDEPATELEKLKTQVQQYLDSPSLPPTDESEHDPLEWWSRYQRLFPALARLAKKYLCMSAVSTPFQEAFTNFGQLMREKKARLDIEVAAQVLFCRSVSRIPEMERIGV